MRNRSRPTEDAPAAQSRALSSTERERPRDEEEATILRARALPNAESAVVEKLKAQTFHGPCSSQKALNAWRSWDAKAGRDFPDVKTERAHADYQHMFARAYDEARQREQAGQVRPDDDTAPMQPKGRSLDDGPTAPMQIAVPHENRPLLEHLQPEQVQERPQDREQTPADDGARARLRAEDKARWHLASVYGREMLQVHRHNPAFADWSKRQRANLDSDERLRTAEGATKYLERLDRAAQEGPAEYRLVANAKAIAASGLVRERLQEERDHAALGRASAREQARALPEAAAARFTAKLAECLDRPEFGDRTYCRVEAQRLRSLDTRSSAERERMVLVSAAYNAPTREFLAANWERDVRLGQGFARNQEQAARDLVNLRARDDAMREDAKLHVAQGKDDAPLLSQIREDQARIALTEDGFERKRLDEDASERAAFLQYVEEAREALKLDEPTAPMRNPND